MKQIFHLKSLFKELSQKRNKLLNSKQLVKSILFLYASELIVIQFNYNFGKQILETIHLLMEERDTTIRSIYRHCP
jgi:hypothetical protein